MKALSSYKFEFLDPAILDCLKEIGQFFGFLKHVMNLFSIFLERFIKKPHKLDIDPKNIFYARFQCPGHKLSGHFGLGLYNLEIFNNTKSPNSIKSIELSYELNGKQYCISSYVAMTGTCYSPLTKTTENVLLTSIGKNAICSIGWNNIRTEIGKHQVLAPKAGVFSGSAYFLFDFHEEEKLSQLKEVKLVIMDWNERKSVHVIPLGGQHIAQQRLELVNKRFIVDDNSKIIMV